jgi:N-acetylglutamate synthase-like GNAT family acetyltransferase
MPATCISTDSPTHDQLGAVDLALDEFNQAHGALRDVQKLCVFASDEQGSIVGGAVGRTWGECAELQQIAVSAANRRQGIGRDLLLRFETAAAARGCRLVYLDTFSFQAPGFYQKHGYRIVLETRGMTHGVVKYTLQKALPRGVPET